MMKKFLINTFPMYLAAITLLIVSAFLRYNLFISTNQLAREFQTQNTKELYSVDTLKISSRLNSFSSALNWVCIEAEAHQKAFFSMRQGKCSTGLFQQKAVISVPEADDLKVSFTIKLPLELQKLFILFIFLQVTLIASIIYATKRAEIERRKKEHEFYELSRRMFHDIRSPLASLNNITELLKTDHKEEVDLLKNSINRINEIANSLLQETQKNAIHKAGYFNLNVLIEEIVAEKKAEYKDKVNIEINALIASKAFLIPSDFKRIISNLLNNSIEASQDSNSSIRIDLGQDGVKNIITIKDNGKGIPEHILVKLGTEEVSTKDQGNGLGFKHSLDLLKEWQGDLKILSSDINGTILQIELLAEKEIKNSMSARVILVDDDELVRATWALKAKKAGITFMSFKDIASFRDGMNMLSKDDNYYIDSELGDIKGETLALELHQANYKNISITSGHPPELFSKYPFLKSIISKTPPF